MLRLYRQSAMHLLILGGTAGRRTRVARLFHDHGPLGPGPFVRTDGRRDEATLREALADWLTRRPPAPGGRGLHVAELGTLFIDCIEALTPATQRLLLAWLTRVPVAPGLDVDPAWNGRVMAGATPELDAALVAGRFSPALLDALDKLRVDLRPRAERGAA